MTAGHESSSRRPPPADARFAFRVRDAAGALRTHWRYWQRLHVFRLAGRPVLTAARMVPHTGELFALYLALKQHEDAPTPSTSAPFDEQAESIAIVRSVADLLAHPPTSLPLAMPEPTHQALQLALTEVLAPHVDALDAREALDATPARERQREQSRLGGLLGGVADEASTRVSASFAVEGLLSARLARIAGDAALARVGDAEDLRDALYRDPRYLRYVRWVMEADGGLVSPVVRGFLRFSCRALAEQLRSEGRFWQERLQAALGQAEADASHTLPYYVVTVLGYVEGGELPMDETDPEATPARYRVAADADLGPMVLQEVPGLARQAAARLFVTAHYHGNVEEVRFLTDPA